MNKLTFTDVNSTSLQSNKKEIADISQDNLNDFIRDMIGDDNYRSFKNGAVRCKNNDQIDFLKYFFDILMEEVTDLNSKHSGDDKSFFNTNKKILSSNIQCIYETLKNYDIDNNKILFNVLGTMIQYIYEKRK